MQWITVATPPLGSIEQFDKVRAHLGAEPAGLHASYVGTADDNKLRIVALWESKEHADRFITETLGPILAMGARPRTGRQAGSHRDRRRTQLRPRAGGLNRHTGGHRQAATL
jgi:hypothetical protein